VPIPTRATLAMPVNWQHVIDRCVDAVTHANYVTAMLLVSLASLTALSASLWALAVSVRAVTSRREIPGQASPAAGRRRRSRFSTRNR
jgi:hypothetical protein